MATPSIENREIRGITTKNIVITVISTASIVCSVLTSYFELKSDIMDVKNQQETTNRVNEIRLKTLEAQVSLLQQEVASIKDRSSSSN